jgi:lipid-A-disaccharide synthase-like uncharacterized protein
VKHQFIWNLWTVIGLLGQGFFFARFFVQWVASERRKSSVIPTAFWFFSMAGSVVLLAYGIHRRDSVIIIGQIPGLFIYSRNLWFIYKGGYPTPAEPPAAASPP